MGTPAEYIEVVKVRFGAPVVASDGASGFVDHVLVDPSSNIVTHVGVKLTRLGSQSYSLPWEVVKEARAHVLELSISRADVPSKSQPAPAEAGRWSGATNIDAGGKHVGRITQVTARQDTHALIHVIVDRGISGGEVVMPAASLSQISSRRPITSLSDAQVRRLTSYRPDQIIEREVNEALYNYSRLRVDLPGIRVRAVDGNVWLLGHISSELNRRVAADQLTDIAGMSAVYNHLITDTDLAAAVAGALGQDARTRDQHIGVYPNLGTITLRGVVATADAREAASRVASGVKGVERVVNELGVKPGVSLVPVLSSVTSRDELVPGGG